MNALPNPFIEDNVVLPEGRGRTSLPYKAVFGKDFFEKIDLEVIHFLQSDKIDAICIEKRRKGFFSKLPAIVTVIRQSETQVECQYR